MNGILYHAFEEFKKLLNYIDENKHIIIKKRQKIMKNFSVD